MTEDYKIIKNEHDWTIEGKIKFCGYGEWVEETDVFDFEYLGYHAAVVRIMKREPFAKELTYFGGHLCGYVRIPDNHPYFGKKDIDLDCHGGLTFNEAHQEHWIGYDCCHSGDYVPTMEHFKSTNEEMKKLKKEFIDPHGFEKLSLFNPVYRNMEYCINECKSMIDQLIVISQEIGEVGEILTSDEDGKPKWTK